MLRLAWQFFRFAQIRAGISVTSKTALPRSMGSTVVPRFIFLFFLWNDFSSRTPTLALACCVSAR